MVKKLTAGLGSIVLIATMVVLLGSSPSAAAGTVVVQGHNLPAANLFEFRDRCSSSTASPPAAQPLGLRSGSVGSHSIGWQFGAGDYEVGALAPVHNPETLSTVAIDVYSPRGVTNGHAVGFYYDTTAGFTAGYWVGFGQVTHTGSGWGTLNTGGLGLNWEYYENGTALYYYPDPMTVSQLAIARGGGGRAYVGVALGCAADAFYVDNLRVWDATDQTVYDFEGVPSASGLGWLGLNKKGKTDVFFDDLAVIYGTKFKMLGLGWDPSSNQVFAGTGSLYELRFGSQSYVRTQGAAFNPKSFAAFKVSPKVHTAYGFAADGTDYFDISGSNVIAVAVLARLDARINDRTLKPGQRAVISGRIGPGDRGTKVSLKRRSGNRWVTVDSARTGGGGSFSVNAKATKVGRMILRLEVGPPRKGVAGAVSTWVYVDVSPRPKPKPPAPPTGGGSSAATETTATTSAGTVPGPDDRSMRLLTRLPSDFAPPPPEPACTLPGPYLAPCAPGPLN
jgi:hypothetical protein